MIFNYEFETRNGDETWAFEPDDEILTTELAKLMLKNSDMAVTSEMLNTITTLLYDNDLHNNEDLQEQYRDDLYAIFEDMARSEMQDYLDYEEDKSDWFGTKKNILG